MNETIYRLADSGGSVRVVIQKKTDGDYIIGISNGTDKPLICQGTQEIADAEFEFALQDYLEKLIAAAIEAKLRAVTEEPPEEDEAGENETIFEMPSQTPITTIPVPAKKTEEQPELDFGF